MVHMLAVVFLMLAVLTFVICWILSGAYRRFGKNRILIVKQQGINDDVSTNINFDARSSTTIFTDIHDEKMLDGATTFGVLTPDLQASDPDNEKDLPYADPVDGMPFEPGEFVVPCVCGLAYREDSVLWLAECQNGRCIHCGTAVSLPDVLRRSAIK
jgi:hypothetical protein